MSGATTLKAGALLEDNAPIKINPRGVNRKAYKAALTNHSTLDTLWLLSGKHKLGLFMFAAGVQFSITALNWAFPAWTELVKSFI